MYRSQSGIMMSLAVSALIAAGCAAGPSAPSSAPTAGAGTAETLEACVARIPATATAGQRMIAQETCERDAEARKGVVGVSAAMPAAASGTQADTLEACLARIPKEATAGQRMIAEASCERDQAHQKAIRSAPGGR